jgi:flagellin-like protein
LKGISPLIASVLLIAFTLAVAAIIGSWLTSMTKTTTDTVGSQLSQQVNCSKVTLDIVDALCINNTYVIISLHNIGSLSLTTPSFYMRTSDQTTCVNSQNDTISGGTIKKYEINCTNFATNKTLNFVKATTLCEGAISISSEKKDFSDSCS